MQYCNLIDENIAKAYIKPLWFFWQTFRTQIWNNKEAGKKYFEDSIAKCIFINI
jgi:hypothetical protein